MNLYKFKNEKNWIVLNKSFFIGWSLWEANPNNIENGELIFPFSND